MHYRQERVVGILFTERFQVPRKACQRRGDTAGGHLGEPGRVSLSPLGCVLSHLGELGGVWLSPLGCVLSLGRPGNTVFQHLFSEVRTKGPLSPKSKRLKKGAEEANKEHA